jgi:hypothetical protein
VENVPLTRGSIDGYDVGRMSFKFTMMDGSRMINCEISDAALGHLAGRQRGVGKTTDRARQFEEYRDRIEKLASSLFDGAGRDQDVLVRIFAKHFRPTGNG